MAYYDFLNVVFAPLLKLPALWAVVALAFAISLVVIIITKYTTNQALMKKLKEEMKEHQKKIKELKNEPEKAIEVQKKAMESNMQYMMHSLKPTIITFIPIILIFGWMSSNFAYEGIKPQQEFSVTAFLDKAAEGSISLNAPDEIKVVGGNIKKIEGGKATWSLKGAEGGHTIELDYNGESQQKDILVASDGSYIEPIKKTNGMIKSIQINYAPRKILNIFGWKLGWLGTYIIFSIIFTMALRKLLNVY